MVSEIEQLASRFPRNREDPVSLESASTALLLRLQASTGVDVPELVWHFLSDADVSFKDPLYASSQMAGLAEALATLGHRPAT
jgi:hypothetical protein